MGACGGEDTRMACAPNVAAIATTAYFCTFEENKVPMKHFVRNIEIENFKSIKHLKADCKRVNVFIGKPNVGKSNILEAISLLGALDYSRNRNKAFEECIRYEEVSNLFHDDEVQKAIKVRADNVMAVTLQGPTNSINEIIFVVGHVDVVGQVIQNKGEDRNLQYSITLDGLANSIKYTRQAIELSGTLSGNFSFSSLNIQNPFRKYSFSPLKQFEGKFPNHLLPPHGDNLFTIVDHNSSLRKEIAAIFQEYGLQFVAYKKESKFEIEKNIDGYVTKFHYSSMADTFQRLIFYFAVIDSNKDAVLILEEPEVHSFPPYTKMLAERIVASTDNQFFLTTHSPYLLQSLVSELDASQLNVFVTYFEQYETKVRALSAAELRRVSEYGIDLFFNLDQFIE